MYRIYDPDLGLVIFMPTEVFTSYAIDNYTKEVYMVIDDGSLLPLSGKDLLILILRGDI